MGCVAGDQRSEATMYFYDDTIINEVPVGDPDPASAHILQEALGGQFGEMRTMNQFLFQSFGFRGRSNAKPFYDLIKGIAVEEISHVELMATTITALLDGSAEGADPAAAPLEPGQRAPNPHHYIVNAQTAMPYDAVANPWIGNYVYSSGNLILDLLNNLVLEGTGRSQKSRLYQMTDNPTARSTLAFLIVRDGSHIKAYAKALEKLGVQWNRVIPMHQFDTSKMPEVRRFEEMGLHNQLFMNGPANSEIAGIFNGMSPAEDGELEVVDSPEGFEPPELPELEAEFAPGLSDELKAFAMKAGRSVGLEVERESRPRRRAR
jgi:Mn-containing catalase